MDLLSAGFAIACPSHLPLPLNQKLSPTRILCRSRPRTTHSSSKAAPTRPFATAIDRNNGARERQPSHEAAGSTWKTATVAVSPPNPIMSDLTQLPPMEQALLLLGFIMCTIMATLFGILAISLPTIHAVRRVAISLEKLSKIARKELPGTIAAIKLSGIEINDLTQQLNRLRTSLQDLTHRGQNRSRDSEAGKSKSSPIMN